MTPILLSLIAYSLAFALGLWIGWKLQSIHSLLRATSEYIVTKLQPKPPEPVKPAATVIDASDPVQRAKWERDQMTNAINSPEINE